VAFDDGAPSAPVAVRNTTSHAKQELQPSGVTQRLTRGAHTLRISLPEDAYQNWNLDYVQLTSSWTRCGADPRPDAGAARPMSDRCRTDGRKAAVRCQVTGRSCIGFGS
jgi:hypothetical protein